jgi:hypothetical protein
MLGASAVKPTRSENISVTRRPVFCRSRHCCVAARRFVDKATGVRCRQGLVAGHLFSLIFSRLASSGFLMALGIICDW